jgi:hypothetical protein
VLVGFELWASLIRQVLDHLSYATSPFCCAYFGDRVSLFNPAFLDHDLPVDASCHCCNDRRMPPDTAFFPVRWGMTNFFCLGCSETMSLLILASRVASLIAVDNQYWLTNCLCSKQYAKDLA